MKILITGSEGFIGKHLVKQLKDFYEVHQVDIKNTVPIDITHSINFDIEFDAVVHLAALVNVNRSLDHPAKYFNVNVNGTLNLLENLNYKHFIFASSASAAGMTNPYGISKRMAEYLVEDHCQKNNKDYTIFRFSNVTGTDGFPPREDSLLAKLMQAEKDGVFQIYGTDYNTPDGTAIRDYTHVNEVCDAIAQALVQPSNSLESLGHGIGTSVKEICDIYMRVNNCTFKIVRLPRRLGDMETSISQTPSKYIRKQYTIEDLLRK